MTASDDRHHGDRSRPRPGRPSRPRRSNIAWLDAVSVPCSAIRSANESAADDHHAGREDRDRDAGDDQRREGDPDRDPARSADHALVAAIRASRRRRPIAHAAHRRDVPRSVGVVAELVPEPPDVDVDGPIEDLGLVLAVDRVEQLVAGQDAAVGLEQRRRAAGTRPRSARRAGRGRGPRGVRGRGRGRRGGSARRSVAAGAASFPARSRIRWTRRTSSAGEKGLGR